MLGNEWGETNMTNNMEWIIEPLKGGTDYNYTVKQHELPWNTNTESFAQLNFVLVI